MDAAYFDQDVVHMSHARGRAERERERHLLVPPDVAAALKSARLARGLSPVDEAASCHVPPKLILSLEAAHSTEFRDEVDLLATVERVATFLGFAPGALVADILGTWSAAYATQSGSRIELVEPLAPTQPLPVVSDQGSALARSGLSSPDLTQGSTPGPQRRGYRSPPPAAEPAPLPARRPARVGRGRLLVICAAAIVVAGVAAYSAIDSRLGAGSHGHSGSSASSLRPPPDHDVSSPLLHKTAAGAGQATYAVSASRYELTVRSDRPSWVRVGMTTGAPQFAGIVRPGIVERLAIGGPVQVEIGAGGTTVTVSSGRSSKTLTPPSAPYTYQLNPQPT